VNLTELVNSLFTNTVDISLPAFRPELTLCVTIVLMLLSRILFGSRFSAFWIALAGSIVGFYLAVQSWETNTIGREEIFTGLLVYDRFTIYFRAFLLLFAILFILLTRLSGIPDREDSPDFYSLVLGGILGMCLMASANHLLMIFLAVEMASVPSYALAGMLKGRRESSEAALKYVIYGAGAAGIMLYGISLLAGLLGSCHLPTMAWQLSHLIESGTMQDRYMVLVLAGLMVAVGLAFKLSAVPFHFWCPDVFEGASAEVNAYLSVASKAGALALLVRIAIGFTTVPADLAVAAPVAPVTATSATTSTIPVVAVSVPVAVTATDSATSNAATSTATVLKGVNASAHAASLTPIRQFIMLLVAFIAAITCTFGNLAAYGQRNIKRMLAYSTIAHAGYMMMPVAAAVALTGVNDIAAKAAYAVIPFYVAVYLFMNLGAFAIVAFLRNQFRTEQITDYAGLVRQSPGLVICFATILFSLVGLPPLAGFAGKLLIFASLVDAIQVDWARHTMIVLLVVGGVNTALSLFYYLNVIKTMTLDPEPTNRVQGQFPMISPAGAYIVLVTLPVLVLGLFWNELNILAKEATKNLFS